MLSVIAAMERALLNQTLKHWFYLIQRFIRGSRPLPLVDPIHTPKPKLRPAPGKKEDPRAHPFHPTAKSLSTLPYLPGLQTHIDHEGAASVRVWQTRVAKQLFAALEQPWVPPEYIVYLYAMNSPYAAMQAFCNEFNISFQGLRLRDEAAIKALSGKTGILLEIRNISENIPKTIVDFIYNYSRKMDPIEVSDKIIVIENLIKLKSEFIKQNNRNYSKYANNLIEFELSDQHICSYSKIDHDSLNITYGKYLAVSRDIENKISIINSYKSKSKNKNIINEISLIIKRFGALINTANSLNDLLEALKYIDETDVSSLTLYYEYRGFISKIYKKYKIRYVGFFLKNNTPSDYINNKEIIDLNIIHEFIDEIKSIVSYYEGLLLEISVFLEGIDDPYVLGEFTRMTDGALRKIEDADNAEKFLAAVNALRDEVNELINDTDDHDDDDTPESTPLTEVQKALAALGFGVEESPSFKEMKDRYWYLIKIYHESGSAPNEEELKLVNAAHEILKKMRKEFP